MGYDFSKLDGVILQSGGHKTPDQGMCVMEAMAYVMNGDTPFSDDPPCMRQMRHRRRWCMVGNDRMQEAQRQRFIPLIPRVMQPCDAEKANREIRILVLAAVREFVPMALEAAGQIEIAKELRALPDTASYKELEQMARKAQRAANAYAAYAAAATAAYAADAADAAAYAAYAADAAANSKKDIDFVKLAEKALTYK